MVNREAPNAAAMGTKAYREKIHKETKFARDHKNLPFTFSKPKKYKSNNVLFICPVCEDEIFITEDTIMVICDRCKTLSRTKPKKD
jgi:uncharacterized membrane protein